MELGGSLLRKWWREVTRGIIVVCFWPPLVEWNGYPPRICLSRVRNLFELRLVVAINVFVIFILSFSARRFVIFEMQTRTKRSGTRVLLGRNNLRHQQ